MDFDDYMKAIENSSPVDWRQISTPLYMGILSPSTQHVGGRDKVVELNVMAPHTQLVFKRNLSITMAKGVGDEKFDWDFTKKFADQNATSFYLDFFFNSALVHREILVSVDGGRCSLPLPKRDLTVSSRWYAVARLVHQVTGGTWDFDTLAQRAGLKPVNVPWPE
ncbi:hypothetical protein G4177_06260 [Corallococcus sp. ZKHCc1 1396]|uniref:Uncharacterized protein n=1 Tax=Corallococcus soli TaxID=2710757 RepID=A0ABR9PIM2_9BACT|nr:hypothetical protein [Corallococcus soli]MBE4747781.1 hypothetical protein [Corallococcus soli]